MLIITGDHGMRDAGGHGGSSYAETNVPFIVVGQKCGESTRESYKQIDIAATLAVLSALPIPASSIGSLIPELLADLTMEHQLFAFHYNAKRLMDKLILAEGSDRIADTEIHEQFEEAKVQHETFIRSSDENLNSVNSEAAFRRAKILYVTATKAMSEQLSKSYIDYDDFSIGAGLLVLLVVSAYSHIRNLERILMVFLAFFSHYLTFCYLIRSQWTRKAFPSNGWQQRSSRVSEDM